MPASAPVGSYPAKRPGFHAMAGISGEGRPMRITRFAVCPHVRLRRFIVTRPRRPPRHILTVRSNSAMLPKPEKDFSSTVRPYCTALTKTTSHSLKAISVLRDASATDPPPTERVATLFRVKRLSAYISGFKVSIGCRNSESGWRFKFPPLFLIHPLQNYPASGQFVFTPPLNNVKKRRPPFF